MKKTYTVHQACSLLIEGRLVGPFTLKVKGSPAIEGDAAQLLQQVGSEYLELMNLEVHEQGGTGFTVPVFNLLDADYRGDGYDQWVAAIPVGLTKDEALLWGLADALDRADIPDAKLTCHGETGVNLLDDNRETLARDAWIAAEFEAAIERKLERSRRADGKPEYLAWDAYLLELRDADPVAFLNLELDAQAWLTDHLAI